MTHAWPLTLAELFDRFDDADRRTVVGYVDQVPGGKQVERRLEAGLLWHWLIVMPGGEVREGYALTKRGALRAMHRKQFTEAGIGLFR